MGDLTIDRSLVEGLLADQHPDLSGLPLVEVASGWDNVMWRLGDHLAVRLPRRDVAASLIVHELEWLPMLAERLPVPVPVAVRSGQAGGRYPWPWAIVPWFDGSSALDATQGALDLEGVARSIGAFITALHQPAPRDAPPNPYRGVPLLDRSAVTVQHLDLLAGDTEDSALEGVDVGEARSLWLDLVDTPAWSGPPVWLHGDLHPGNLIIRDGDLAGVIDFGDLTAGDPATDLLLAWALLPPDLRPVFRHAIGSLDDDTWRRGRAWALAHGAACMALGSDDPRIFAMGRRTLLAVLGGG